MKATLEELQTLIAVADCGSISKAATELAQTISATSRSLRRLEEKLGVGLFRRTTRKLELTGEGEEFLYHARSVVATLEEAEARVQSNHQSPQGKLRVDASTPVMLHVLAPVISQYIKAFPKIELQLSCNEGIVDLIDGNVDVAFRVGDLKDSTLCCSTIGYSRLRLLASPVYLADRGTPQNLADLLEGHSLLGFSHCQTLNKWPVGPDSAGVSVRPSLSSTSGEALKALAIAGVGIVCLADYLTVEARQKGLLVPLELGCPARHQTIRAVYYKNIKINARAKSFIDFVRSNRPSGVIDTLSVDGAGE